MKRNDIIQRIANLRALADKNNNEAEAMAALRKAERLMEGYRIEEAEIAMAEAAGRVIFDIVQKMTGDLTVGRTGRVRHRVQMCLVSIAEFTETKPVMRYENRCEFTGDLPDVELALYIVEVIQNAMDEEYRAWRRGQPSVGRGAKGTFQSAMAHRINSRLREKPAQPELPKDHIRSELTSTALVVASINQEKKEKVEASFNASYPRTTSWSGFSYKSNNNSAYQAGHQAGARVSFSKPVTETRHAALR